MNLEATVARVEQHPLVGRAGECGARRSTVGANVGLDPAEKRRARLLDHQVVVDNDILEAAGEDELHLASVSRPGAEQWILRQSRRRILAAAHDRREATGERGDARPQRGRGVEQEEVHVPLDRERIQNVEVARRQTRQPEQRHPRRQVDERRLSPQPRTGVLHALRRARLPDPLAQPSPQLGLPAAVASFRPRQQHRRPMNGIAVVEIGDVPHAAQPARAPPRIRVGSRPAEVRRQRRQPRLSKRRLDHLQQRPHRPLRQPRIGLAVDAGSHGDGPVDEPTRKRELHVRAHAVTAARRSAEHDRQPLRQPALHAARRHGHDLGLQGICQRLRRARRRAHPQARPSVPPGERETRRRSSSGRERAFPTEARGFDCCQCCSKAIDGDPGADRAAAPPLVTTTSRRMTRTALSRLAAETLEIPEIEKALFEALHARKRLRSRRSRRTSARRGRAAAGFNRAGRGAPPKPGSRT